MTTDSAKTPIADGIVLGAEIIAAGAVAGAALYVLDKFHNKVVSIDYAII